MIEMNSNANSKNIQNTSLQIYFRHSSVFSVYDINGLVWYNLDRKIDMSKLPNKARWTVFNAAHLSTFNNFKTCLFIHQELAFTPQSTHRKKGLFVMISPTDLTSFRGSKKDQRSNKRPQNDLMMASLYYSSCHCLKRAFFKG